ncbi:hypothetical protein [Micromonospora marina]|uniref:hypothetical protein n=1 Tax=Micromonospora marina TaxID=307120 RepID=UPI003D71D18B
MSQDPATSVPISKYSSSTGGLGSSSYDDVVVLGRELTDSLDSNDTLGRWMAHYIADLIDRAETADGPDRDTLQHECAAEIMRLWSHRHSFRDPQRPMASFEPVYRALARLDPDNPPWSFLRTFSPDTAPKADQLEINALLKAALEIEDAARDAVRELIASAAGVASHKEAKWIDLAKHIQDEESGLVGVLRRLRYAGVDDAPDESADELGESMDEVAAPTAVQALEALATACRAALEVVDESVRDSQVSSG